MQSVADATARIWLRLSSRTSPQRPPDGRLVRKLLFRKHLQRGRRADDAKILCQWSGVRAHPLLLTSVDPPVRNTSRIHAAVVLLAASTFACSGDGIAAPSPRGFSASVALLAAVEDATQRVLPSLNAASRSELDSAVAALHAGLLAGDIQQTRAALSALNAALATGERQSAASAADLAVLAVMATAAEQSLPAAGGSEASLAGIRQADR